MQFHLNGFRTGDPAVQRVRAPERTGIPAEVDVLIIGCGPAGLTLAAQLSAFSEIRTLIVDQKSGPLQLGQADGVACRTMEMFQAFGFSQRVLKEAYWVNETVFWRPDPANPARIARSGRVQDTEDGLSEFPHVILNQARVHDFYLDVMRDAPAALEPAYGMRLVGLEGLDSKGEGPVTAHFERCEVDTEETHRIKARFVVGCDGARSSVRKALGLELRGESANQAWGVMDVLAVTDFPDVRFKALIQSQGEGSILIIPREGGYLFRLYIEIDKLAEGERIANRNVTADDLIEAARRILKPYTLDVKEVAWWSVYDIGQRLCDRFDDLPAESADDGIPRVFIAGDACHTHSPKAGQGMNVSMQDAFNLGWKLASVLKGQSAPHLLRTYSAERQAVAQDLIDFDKGWAKLLSMPLRQAGDEGGDGVDPAEVQRSFVQHGRYTAGTATLYTPSVISGTSDHQSLAEGFLIGTRFHSAPVVRLADAKPMELGHVIMADGRWRLFAFADKDDPTQPASSIHRLCDALETSPQSPLRRFTPPDTDIDAVIDVRAVFQQTHHDLALEQMPRLLRPTKGRLGLTDYEKMFCADTRSGVDIFDSRGIDREKGCVVIVRPDQYVAHILPLEGFDELAEFFAGFMVPAL